MVIDETRFAKRMVRIGESVSERVAEDRRSQFERDTMLAQVASRLGIVPFELQHVLSCYPISPSTGDEALA